MPQEALILAAPPLADNSAPGKRQPTRLEYRVLCKTIFPSPRMFQSVGLPPPRKKNSNPPLSLCEARSRDVIETYETKNSPRPSLLYSPALYSEDSTRLQIHSYSPLSLLFRAIFLSLVLEYPDIRFSIDEKKGKKLMKGGDVRTRRTTTRRVY